MLTKKEIRWLVLTGVILAGLLYYLQDQSLTIRVISSFVFLLGFVLGDRYFEIGYRKRHHGYMIIIIVAGIILSPLYSFYLNYDKVLHFVFPILVSSLVFYILNQTKLTLRSKLALTFLTVLGILAIFEIVEYLLDLFFELKLQGVFVRSASGLDKFDIIQDPLSDTMTDLILGMIGSGSYVITNFILTRFGKDIEKGLKPLSKPRAS